MMTSSFRAVIAAKLETLGEYIYLWDKLDKLLYPVVLNSLCEPVCRDPRTLLYLSEG